LEGLPVVGKHLSASKIATHAESQGELTVLTIAVPKSQSLRAIVPIGIVHKLRLKGDNLVWELRPEDNELIVVMRLMRSGQSKEEEGAKKYKRQ
jgi:hypothetical protein